MSTFRILNPFPTYLDLSGNLAAGGSLKFYESGTTTPKDVYGDPDKDTNNGSTVEVGTDGRPVVDIWGDGAYRVRLYDADGTLIDEADNVELPGGTSQSIPAFQSGKFLTNDGAVLAWASILQLPDPTGAANKILSTDGENFFWTTKPSDGEAGANADVTVLTDGLKVGNGTGDRFYIQTGDDKAPASGGHVTSKTITFPTAFKSIMYAAAVPTGNSYATAGYGVTMCTLNKSTTGATFEFNTQAYNTSTGNIVSDLPFDWIAFGTIAAS